MRFDVPLNDDRDGFQMSLQQQLTEILSDAFEAEGVERSFGEVVVSQRPELADYQCNGALAAAKSTGRNPREIARGVAGRVDAPDLIAGIEIAGPGFLNLSVHDGHLASWVARMEKADRLNVAQVDDPRTIIVDYGGPNMSKALHVGHLRSAVIGESLKRIFRFLGYHTIGDIHIGDWGMPIGQLIIELEDRHPDLPYFDPEYDVSVDGPYPAESPVTLDDLSEMYPVITRRCAEDPEVAERARQATFDLQNGREGYLAVWKHFHDVSVAGQKKDFGALGVEFDVWYGESTVHDRLEPMVSELLGSGVARESEGAVVIDVAEPEDTKEFPPLLLTRSDGSYLYSTTDLATIDMRVADMEMGAGIYVVDARQSLHFEQVFRAARRAGYAPADVILEHVGFGTVNGKDGKPFKTREGGVLRLGDLIALIKEGARARLDEAHIAEEYPAAEREEIARQVGLAALKFGDLTNHRMSNYVFDIDRFSAFEGKTGPYLQYSAVRIKSILRKVAEAGLAPGPIIAPTVPQERALMLRLVRLEEIVYRAANLRAPNVVAEYAYEVATDLSRFYERCHILREENPERQASWIALIEVTLATHVVLLDLLGIEIPERM
ncbi:MAG: arginine--tRNA ligase [Actinomycetota bacterium]|nr:arginine--tRNA ligase [Actinomycetota bacterium]